MKDLGYLSHIVTGLILFGVYSMCVVVIDGEHKSSMGWSLVVSINLP